MQELHFLLLFKPSWKVQLYLNFCLRYVQLFIKIPQFSLRKYSRGKD